MHFTNSVLKSFVVQLLFIILFFDALSQTTIDLAGQWTFRLDPKNQGIEEKWFTGPFNNTISLPGALQEQGYGNQITAHTRWYPDREITGIWRNSPIYKKYRQPGNIKIFEFLQPEKYYVGAAWYQRQVTIPADWKNKRILLFLERVHWSSTVWVDDQQVSTKNSLATPHEYDLSKYLHPDSTYTLTIRVDNSQIVNIGEKPHSVSDETKNAWNGIIGQLTLEAKPKVWIRNVQVYPDIHHKYAKIFITVGNQLQKKTNASLTVQIKDPDGNKLTPLSKELSIAGKEKTISVNYPIGDTVLLWDEFHPVLYHLTARLNTKNQDPTDTAHVTFGMREFATRGTHFQINGRITSLRGNVNCAVFPLHGYPRMDVQWWKKLFTTYKSWGLNAVRFHSWCPPEAAFTAADEVGIYLQPEVDEWCNFTTLAQDTFFRKESARILKKYGNHPSFVMMALGNERSADSSMLQDLLSNWRQDTRRVYSGKSGGNPVLDDFGYYDCGQFGPLRIRYHKGWPPVPSSTLFNTRPPQTAIDWRKGVAAYDKPLVAHEIGQRCAYPDVLHEPEKYTGLLKAAYLDIARDQLLQRGMLKQVPDFVRASGLWQIQLYKEEIEASMRTPGLGGFSLLSLEDFPGQRTAPVGMLDVFYDKKPYVSAKRFRHFCSPVVLLARMKKRVWENNETFGAEIALYNFGDGTFNATNITCEIKDTSGYTVFKKTFPGENFPLGNNLKIGKISFDLQNIKAPAKYTLSVVARTDTSLSNQWDFWVFPQQADPVDTSAVVIAHTFNKKIQQQLKNGSTVLLLPDTAMIKGDLPICFTGFYWTAFGLTGGESSAGGLLCNPSHPVFKYFPTSFHTNWQWWDLLTHARPMILDNFNNPHPFPKDYKPLIQMIDSWKVNRKLGVLLEGKVGKGKLIICAIDLEHDLDKRPATRQFKYSLLSYLTSPDFNPKARLTTAMVEQLFYHYPDTNIVIDPKQSGFRYDGVGAISAGASSRLLFDYPEPERSQILDYLFKPGYGASMQLLKVEIGGDMNSTDGSEASHERQPGEINCNRGYEWWLMKEAKKRNPDIKLIGLCWGAPGWVKNFWSSATINYIIDWLECAHSKGITIDYIGGWNERGWNAEWYIALDSALQEHFPKIKVIAADAIHDPWSIASEMVRNPALKRAIDVVGVHEACGWRTDYTRCASTEDARSLGKPLWNSEHSSMAHDVGAVPLARAMNRLYIQGKITGNLCWSLVSAWYASLPIADTGPLLAEWPWSGYYELGKSIWVYAHTAQFTEPGWQYIDSACGFLASGASFVTLQSPDKKNFTTVIEAMDAKAAQKLSFSLKANFSGKTLHVWETKLLSDNSKDYFNHVKDVTAQNGVFEINIKPGHIYTISTTTGHKGTARSHAEISEQMSLPFKENFDSYEQGRLARYFSDINGGFETAPCGGKRKGLCYRQMVTQQPVSWTHKELPPVTLLGDPRWWGDYKVSADVLLEQKGYIELLGRVSAQSGLRIAGYHLQVNSEGEWKLYSQDLSKKDLILLSGKTDFNRDQWHNITLAMRGSSIKIFLDAKLLGRVKDDKHITGQVGFLVSPWQNAQFDNVEIEKTADWPHFIPKTNMHATATSQHTANYKGYNYVANNAIDDRPETTWHSEWKPQADLPQSITFDLGKEYQIQGLVYQPRSDGNTKGMITTYAIYVSDDNIHFKKVVSGKWPATSGSQLVQWTRTIQGRYLKLVAVNGEGGLASAGEISIIEGPSS